MLQVKVFSKDGKYGPYFYNAVKVEDCIDDNDNYCYRIVCSDGSSATFYAPEWYIQTLKWVNLF